MELPHCRCVSRSRVGSDIQSGSGPQVSCNWQRANLSLIQVFTLTERFRRRIVRSNDYEDS